ncbi:cell division protein FtsL [Candidatus Dependentiae bacterium]|nr:cell division protein FtsL [Candidatus Dependentiae bacterium]
MNSRNLLMLFIGIHLCFPILHIHKHSQVVKYSYTKQKLERELETLNKKREQLVLHLHELKSPDSIRQFAKNDLGMTHVSLQQIKKLTS